MARTPRIKVRYVIEAPGLEPVPGEIRLRLSDSIEVWRRVVSNTIVDNLQHTLAYEHKPSDTEVLLP